MNKSLLILLALALSIGAQAQDEAEKKEKISHWYDKIGISGYMQIRYNRLLETNPQLKNDQGDKSWGENGGLFNRRTRIKVAGQIHKRVYFYIQPDLASSITSTDLHLVQIRDAYVDVGFDDKNEFRVRLGQSKIPFGFENMQSSQNRIPLDRNDGINSALRNERDMAAIFYWAPDATRKLFAKLVREGLKGSGDYGVVGLGVFNGQTANRPDLNNNMHVVGRVSYPFYVGKQIIETGIQGYTGHYVITDAQLSKGVKTNADRNYIDKRTAATFVLYPQPFGIQAEYNIGKGPEYNKITDSIDVKNLSGGYVTLSYMLKYKNQVFMPFSRGHIYTGGKKFERDARSYDVKELEVGVEWLPFKNFELTVMYTMSERRFEDNQNPFNTQKGNLLRLQGQLNF